MQFLPKHSNLIQTVPLVMRNLSNMFVYELVVLDSVKCNQHMLEDLLFFSKPLGGVLHWSG